MIRKVQVNLNAVFKLLQVTEETSNFSSKIQLGVECITTFLEYLGKLESNVKTERESLNESHKNISNKIIKIQDELNALLKQKEVLQEIINDLREKLDSICETITVFDVDGNEEEEPNPEYDSYKEMIIETEDELSDVNEEILAIEERLNFAKVLSDRLKDMIAKVLCVLEVLAKAIITSKELRNDLIRLVGLNKKSSLIAITMLKKISQIIQKYMQVVVKYEKLEAIPKYVPIIDYLPSLKVEYISNCISNGKRTASNITADGHVVKYDINNRICEYDGRVYGGAYNDYDTRLKETPLDESDRGYFVGERGESLFIPLSTNPKGQRTKEILEDYGLTGITYRNAEPDFEECAEAVVEIDHMTEYRSYYYDKDGIKQLGNFEQADRALAMLLTEQSSSGRIITAMEVSEYRHRNGLTWHEKCDGKTMVMLKSEINLYFNHLGGCSECAKRDGTFDEGEFDE